MNTWPNLKSPGQLAYSKVTWPAGKNGPESCLTSTCLNLLEAHFSITEIDGLIMTGPRPEAISCQRPRQKGGDFKNTENGSKKEDNVHLKTVFCLTKGLS